MRIYAFNESVGIWKYLLDVACKHICGNGNTSSFAADIKDIYEGKRVSWKQVVITTDRKSAWQPLPGL